MILIATRSDDEHTDTVIRYFDRRKIDYVRFETAAFLRDARVSLWYGDVSGKRKYVKTSGGVVPLEKITGVWYRRPLSPRINADMALPDQEFVRDEARCVLDGLWHLLEDRFWVNPYLPDKAAHNKVYQLQIARQVGLEIPKTIITNNSDEALAGC